MTGGPDDLHPDLSAAEQSADTAMTSEQNAVAAEQNAVANELAALRAQTAAEQTEIVALRAEVIALRAEVVALRAVIRSMRMPTPQHGWLRLIWRDLETNPHAQYTVHRFAVYYWLINFPLVTVLFFGAPMVWLKWGLYITLIYSIYANLSTDYSGMSAAMAAFEDVPPPPQEEPPSSA